MRAPLPTWPPGSSEMAARIRAFNWASTPLGPIQGWPANLRTAVEICLGFSFPSALFWGPELTLIHNDAHIPVLGTAFPGALGRPAPLALADSWPVLEPHVSEVLTSGAGVGVPDLVARFDRGDEPRVAHLSVSFGPLHDESAQVSGVLITAIETAAWARAEEALRVSEAKYRTLFESIDEGFCIFEMLFDDADVPIDYRWLEYNPAFERHTGLTNVIGVRGLDLLPEQDPYWLKVYGDVALTGEPARVVRFDPALERWIDVYAFRTGEPEQRRVATLFSDITEQKNAELSARASEERQRFLLTLSDALRPLSDPVEMQRAAVNLLADELGVMRATYFEVEADQDSFVLTARAERDAAPIPDRMRLSGFAPEISAAYRAGQTLVFRDTEMETQLGSQPEAYRPIQIRAWAAAPLVKAGQLVAIVGVHSRTPRDWTEAEVRLIEELAERTWAMVERAHAEAALRESEEKYRGLFDAMGEGFCVVDIVRDETGAAVDLLYVELNPAFERHTGMVRDQVVGRRLSEVFTSGDVARWVAPFAQVADSGEPATVEEYTELIDRWSEGSMYPRGNDRVAVFYRDVTPRKIVERALRASEERQAFLLNLSDALRPLGDSHAIQAAATELLRDHLSAGWCYYVEWNAAAHVGVVHRDATRAGLPSLAGVHDVSDVPEFLETLGTGQSLVVPDYADYALLSPRIRARYTALGFQSMVLSPLVKDGRLVASLLVGDTVRRDWPDDAAALVAEVADRTWAALERTRAEAALRESEAKYRVLFESIDEGFAVYEVVRNDAGHPVDMRVLDVNPAYERLMHRPNATGKLLSQLAPGMDREWVETMTAVAISGEAARMERYNGDIDAWFDVYVTPTDGPDAARVILVFSEITARKRADAALRESEERYRLIVQEATDYAIFSTDPAGIIETWSPGAERVFGWTAEEAIGQPYAMTFTPDDQAAGTPELEFVAARDEGQTPNVRWHARKNGDEVFIEGTAYAIRGPNGTFRGLFKIGQDVTERRLGDERRRDAFEIETVGVVFYDQSGWITDANNAFLRMTGLTREEVSAGGAHWHDLAPSEWRPAIQRMLKSLADGAPAAPIERENLNLRGPSWWGLAAPRRLADGSIVEFVLDVTARRRAEEALRASETRFRAVVNLVPDLLWQSEPDGWNDWYNDRWLAYTGQTPAEAAGWGWTEAIHPDDRTRSAAAYATAMEHSATFTQEHRIRSAGGEHRWFQVRAEPLFGADGSIMRWFGAATDIHDARVARTELEARVAAATAELRVLSRRLLSVQEEERRYLANELHDEIGQTLTGLGLQLGKMELSPEQLADAAATVKELTDQVRQLSMDLRPTALDRYGLLPAIRWHLERYERRTGVRVAFRHEGVDHRFAAPVEIAVYRIVQEALTNVARHAGVDRATVQLYADEVALTLSIRDRGRGFDPALAGEGSGLGGIRERARLLGGEVTIDAEPGEGVAVTAEIPVNDPDDRG